jgi:hypothetical protein
VARGDGISKVYVAIAVFVIILIIFTIFFSGNQLIWAYIDDDFLVDSWKDAGMSENIERLLGLEKQGSLTYMIDENIDDRYPAFITVTSMKTLFMMNEQELLDTTINTIHISAEENNILLDENSSFSGNRATNKGHKTNYIIFHGNETTGNITEEIRIIGETWSCGISCTSIICIGVAQITDRAHNNLDFNYTHWIEIVGDREGTFVNKYNNSFDFMYSDGLIFNVECH